ncbi:UDP-4-amino-4,6-dideoxy-N-acetyl-beta-L-altrosamine transaminase [Trichloromonas sp.]|uniref:UDP-4-amino-4, 6-dideoxy-N-acetyl-beta-L-altrosamine transaminase n=1 Tax=Trichloromonas sp. TaxID=3069249 RepID=UPI002A3826AA|nr:UDP-4-amino-4,6-dideoxy-N-acetyl-beta-L-altrosamine transaminase [Trichloromonas sp.]
MSEPFISYGRQSVDESDIEAVVAVLRSDWLTTGPLVERFERSVADFVGVAEGVAVSSGTAALHGAMHAIGIGPGDEVIVPPMTFAATANAVLYQGGTPVFADADADTLLIDPARVEEKIGPRTRAVIAVDYAGQPADYGVLREICRHRGLILVADACHALGAADAGRPCGSLADLSAFSFHPVKPITTGEGGMVVTDNPEWAERLRSFRNHGITGDHRQRQEQGTWYYEMTELGGNYRLTDIQCALGLSQLARLPKWIARRRELAALYDRAFAGTEVQPLAVRAGAEHGYHLYVVRVPERDRVFAELRAAGIGANVHYIPVHLHPYYRRRFGTGEGLCPVAEAAYGRILTLPLYPAMNFLDVSRIVDSVFTVIRKGA